MLGTDVKVFVCDLRNLEAVAFLEILIDDVREYNVSGTACDKVTDDVRAGIAGREVELEGARSALVAALVGLVGDDRGQRTVFPREGHLTVGTTLTCDVGHPPASGSICT